MAKLTLLIVALFGIGLMLSGCTGGGTTIGSKRDPFLGGTTGISVDFAQGAPPGETFDGGDSPFDVIIILENKGEYDVPASDCRVRIKGILASDFSKSEGDLTKNPPEDVEATSKNSEGDILPGPQVYVEFTGFNHDNPLTGNTPFTLLAEVCYKYENDAQAMLCISEDILDIAQDNRVCTVSESKTIYNSGGPVHVENFKEMPAGEDKVRFYFDVVHSGTGDIYKEATQCNKDSMSDEDRIWVEVESTISGAISCTGLTGGDSKSGYVKLYNAGKMTITCTQEVSTNSDYETPVNIKLRYDYEQTKTKEIIVKHIEDN